MSRWKNIYEVLTEIAPGIFEGSEPIEEAEHFYVCAYCEQAVDMRRRTDVFYHDQPGHRPLKVN